MVFMFLRICCGNKKVGNWIGRHLISLTAICRQCSDCEVFSTEGTGYVRTTEWGRIVTRIVFTMQAFVES